jgi:hypothetical protein
MAIDYNDNDFIYDTHWLSMKRAIAGNGLLTGMGVTEAGVPNMTVLVTAGTYRSANIVRVYAGATITIDPADVTDDRWDLISGGPAGLTYTAGAPGVIQVPPDLPSVDDIIVAMIKVPANDLAITNAQIYDFGFYINAPEHATTHIPGGTDAIATGVPVDIGTANAEGAGVAFARNNHVHNIPALAITTARLDNLSVTTGKIAALAVTAAEIANATIPHGKIAVANIDGLAATPSMRTIGTGAVQACAGNDARLTDSRSPTTHGASLHTDRLRKIPINIVAMRATSLEVDAPFYVDPGAIVNRGLAFVKGSNSYQWVVLERPNDYVTHGTLYIGLAQLTSGGTGTNVVMDIMTQTITHTLYSAPTQTYMTCVTAPGIVRYTGLLGVVQFPTNAASVLVGIRRYSASASDTYSATVLMVSAMVDYTADM